MPAEFAELLEELEKAARGRPEDMAALAKIGAHVDPGWLGLADMRLSGWFNKDLGELFSGFTVGPNDLVLDAGCGDGGTLNFCTELGARVILADIDADRVRQAADTIERSSGTRPEMHVTDGNPMPLPNAHVTRVVCQEVLEHVDDPAAFMAELVRVGKPGAYYLLTVPDPVAEQLQTHVAPPAYFQKPNHIRIFQREEFAALVEGAGLTIERRSYYGSFWAIWWMMFWSCNVPFDGDRRHPALDNWARTWASLLATPDGIKLKRVFDRFVPKNQVIVARK